MSTAPSAVPEARATPAGLSSAEAGEVPGASSGHFDVAAGSPLDVPVHLGFHACFVPEG